VNPLPIYPGVSPLVTRRLPRYYRHLTELMKSGVERISSREFADMIGFTASQIRQDLNCFGGFGQQGYGYNVATLRAEIGRILSVDKSHGALILGAGHLGVALANNMGFEQCGFRLAGIFDVDSDIVGTTINGCVVRHISELEEFCAEQKPLVGVLCTPPTVVPELVKNLASFGVKSFWNFSQCDISTFYPNEIVVEDVQLSDSLMNLSFHLNETLCGQ